MSVSNLSSLEGSSFSNTPSNTPLNAPSPVTSPVTSLESTVHQLAAETVLNHEESELNLRYKNVILHSPPSPSSSTPLTAFSSDSLLPPSSSFSDPEFLSSYGSLLGSISPPSSSLTFSSNSALSSSSSPPPTFSSNSSLSSSSSSSSSSTPTLPSSTPLTTYQAYSSFNSFPLLPPASPLASSPHTPPPSPPHAPRSSLSPSPLSSSPLPPSPPPPSSFPLRDEKEQTEILQTVIHTPKVIEMVNTALRSNQIVKMSLATIYSGEGAKEQDDNLNSLSELYVVPEREIESKGLASHTILLSNNVKLGSGLEKTVIKVAYLSNGKLTYAAFASKKPHMLEDPLTPHNVKSVEFRICDVLKQSISSDDLINFSVPKRVLRLTTNEEGCFTEFCNGGGLDRILGLRLNSARPWSVAEAEKIALQMAKTVRILHSAHIVHRDLKPDNWLINVSDGGEIEQIKLSDFGQASLMDSERVNYDLIPIDYFPWEALENNNLKFSPAVDVFQLGLVFYQIYTSSLELPFQWGRDVGSDPEKRPAYRAKRQDPDSWPKFSEIPVATQQLIKAMIDPDPIKRPSMELVCQQLEKMATANTP